MEVENPAMAYGEDPYGNAADAYAAEGDYYGDEINNNNEDMMMLDLDSMPVTQEDAWAVISAYFDEKGLVRQQLDSFNEFIQNTMQELVDDSGSIRVSPEIQHLVGYDEQGFDEVMGSDTKKVFEVKFGQVYFILHDEKSLFHCVSSYGQIEAALLP